MTQEQATDLWTYLVTEAREIHGTGPKESGQKAASIVSEGADQPAAKKVDAPTTGKGKGQGTGKGKGKGQDNQQHNPDQKKNPEKTQT